MDVVALATAGFNAIGSALGLWGKHQDRVNAPKIVANVDAARDLKEKEKVTGAVTESEKTGSLDEERKLFAED